MTAPLAVPLPPLTGSAGSRTSPESPTQTPVQSGPSVATPTLRSPQLGELHDVQSAAAQADRERQEALARAGRLATAD